MENRLTDRDFWRRYWENYQYSPIPSKLHYDSYIPKDIEGKRMIEIGGFPGANAIYFHKKYGCLPTIVDFYIDHDMVRKQERINEVNQGVINCIEADFFALKCDEKFDVVLSVGFIEHFEDTRDVIRRHIELLVPNGELIIVLPNFRGLNGVLQRWADRKNYLAHNLQSMQLDRLRAIMGEFTEVNRVRIEYTRKPMLWLEPKPTTVNFVARKMVKGVSHLLKLVPLRCQLLSPYIIIRATGVQPKG